MYEMKQTLKCNTSPHLFTQLLVREDFTFEHSFKSVCGAFDSVLNS